MSNIEIQSDGNQLAFVKKQMEGKNEMLVYEYTKNISKKGQTLSVTKEQLDRMVSQMIVKILN